MTETGGMRGYWDRQASSGRVNWHIAHTSEDDEEFFATGFRALKRLFPEGLDFLPENAFVLDIGCGKGRVTRAMAQTRPDARVFGLDVSPEMVSQAYAHAAGVPNAAYVVGPGDTLAPFPADMFDLVYSIVVFQHLPRHHVQRYLWDAARVLRPGGHLIFQVQSRPQPQEVDPPWDDYRKIRYYTPDQATALVREPLVVEDTRGGGHDFFVTAVRPEAPAAAGEGPA